MRCVNTSEFSDWRWPWVFAGPLLPFFFSAVLAPLAEAGEPAKDSVFVPPVMDAASKKLLEAWEQKVNNPGRDGVKSITVNVKATFSDSTTTKPYETTGTFKWSHEEGGQKTVMQWSSKVLGDVLGELGWPVKAFADYYDKDAFKRSLSGATIQARSEPASLGAPFLRDLRQDGRQLEAVPLSPRTAISKKQSRRWRWRTRKMVDITTKSTGKMEGEKYLETGWTLSYTDPQGKFDSTVQITFDKISGFNLWSKVEEKMVRGGKPFGNITLEFSGYKVNDAPSK